VTIYLVRHAKAGNREKWNAADHLRPLSKAGWRQAEGLVDLFAGAGFDRLVSSPFVRCRQTLEPLAHRLGLAVELDDALAEGAGARPTLELMRNVGESPVALSTHGDVVMDVMTHLIREGVQLSGVRGEMPLAKGSTWIIEGRGSRFTSASYVPPPDV
jgi:8-oxo-dGTP diphosphatase